MSGPHLVADITPHGFGHLSQSACVLNALHHKRPDIRITVRCQHDRAQLEEFISIPFETAPAPPDPGMCNLGPSRVDAQESLRIYQDLFSQWDAILKREIAALDALKPDLHFSNVGFVGPAAAAKIGVKSIGLCSLNWLDVFSSYCGDLAGGRDIVSRLEQAYSGLELFLRPTPSMDMVSFPNRQSIAPISRLRQDANADVVAALRHRLASRAIGLASLGGIKRDTGWTILPRIEGLSWITPRDAPPDRDDIIDCRSSGLDYFDAVCAADIIVTKTGYGTFTEAACNSVRLLYAARPDWPESPPLESWVEANARAKACTQEDLYSGAITPMVEELLSQEPAAPARAGGDSEAADILIDYLT